MLVDGADGVEAQAGASRVLLRFLDTASEARVLGETRVPSGTTVFDAASWNAIAIDSTCGGHGTCRKCKVRVVDGAIGVSNLDPRAFSPDELADGWRLACRANAHDDLIVEVPPLQSRPKAALAGVGRHVILRPAVQKRHLVLDEPNLDDQVSDLERVFAAMDDLELHASLGVIRELGGVLRKSGYDVTAVVVDDELIAVEPGDTTASCHALAFDLGTTTVVATLLDLTTGQPLSVHSRLNRQHTYGADVIARISATMIEEGALEDLRQQAHWTLAELTKEVCAEAGADPTEIYEIVVAGNVTMIQLALGIDPEPLGMAPFIVASRAPISALASDFGVEVHPRAPAVTFPALGAYVGPDILAGLIATGLTRDRRIRLFIDVGTNCEIVLGSSSRALATAAPAGPAFEGASIRCGMRAAEGAIEGVRITDDDVEIQVIGDIEPTGICGSGLVDVVSELLRVGLVEPSGRLLTEDEAAERAPGLVGRLARVANGNGGEERVFVLARRGEDPAHSVYLSQVDVRRLQEAKAAIATGWKMLVRQLGIEETEIQQVLLGGSFGAYLTPASAVRIGLVPPLTVTRIVAAGNVAGEGAKIAALSLPERHAATALLDEVEYVEASGNADYNDLFLEELTFPAASSGSEITS
jgi:uncharacterized 2Fe-2S/4Fe-4S cluster protein (DUF4445 family)